MNCCNYDLMFSGHTATGSLLMVFLARIAQMQSEAQRIIAVQDLDPVTVEVDGNRTCSRQQTTALLLAMANSLLQIAARCGDRRLVLLSPRSLRRAVLRASSSPPAAAVSGVAGDCGDEEHPALQRRQLIRSRHFPGGPPLFSSLPYLLNFRVHSAS